MLPSPGIFVGWLRHRRFAPVAHRFRYPVFQALLDVDRIPELMAVSRLTGYNRLRWASFDDRDHLGDPSRPLRARVVDDARRAGVALDEGPIFLLTNLRYLGYVFNPVSFFYCYTPEGRVQAVLAEVHNTFGGSHNYWLTGKAGQDGGRALRYRAPKVFHVSPFLPMDLDYRFALSPPLERLVAHIETWKGGARQFDATLALSRRPWTPREIRRVLARHPFMTGRTIAAIHFEALRLFLKGVPFHRNPHQAGAAG
jgi:uncharacterized protein